VVQQVPQGVRWVGRAVGLDLHRDFCELAICEDGVVRSAGRVRTTPEALEVLGASLEPTDRVAMEVSGGSWEVARILEGHVQQVIVVSPEDTGIAQARTKTDKLDARTLAKLLCRCIGKASSTLITTTVSSIASTSMPRLSDVPKHSRPSVRG
jgi:hypothetical protein